MEWIKGYFRTPGGQIVGSILAVVMCGLIFYEVRSLFGLQVPAEMNEPWFVCSQTGKGFHHTLVVGETIPVYSPFSGTNTGYPAELCYWNADGSIKSDPTPVLLNSTIGNPEPTFCPDCGRLVVGHNPRAREGMKPPPTKQEYERMHATNGQ